MIKFDPQKWMNENSHIYLAFEREAIAVSQRRKHYSARTIVEFLRHHTLIAEQNGAWKINNDAIPYLARKFVQNHPHLKHLFSMREH